MTAEDFFSDLLIQFPEVGPRFGPDDGTHFKMEGFAEYTIGQIKIRNFEEVKKCFNYIESRLDFISIELENALNVSYCEVLIWYDDDKRGIQMKKIMPGKLFLFYSGYKKYYVSLG